MLLGALCIAALATAGAADATAGSSLTGTLMDMNGHPVSGASVVAVHQASRVRSAARADELGAFVLSGLPAGVYVLRVEWTGFKPLVTNPVTVDPGAAAHLSLTLELDGGFEHVSVQYRPPLLQADSAVVGHVVSGSTASALPLSGRNLAQLALLLPGVVTTAPASLAQPRVDSEGRPFVNGHREQGNSFVLDGLEANDVLKNTQPYEPSPEAVEEIRFETNNYSAQYGNVAGAMIQATLKSGSSGFRGSVFASSRPRTLAANRWELNRVHAERPRLGERVLGATLSGPIWKDKLFFFADYEGYVKNETTLAIGAVAPLAWRHGDFSGLRNTNGATIAIVDPLRRSTARPFGEPFPGNRIPPERFSPLARALLADPSLYPLPNGEDDIYTHSMERPVRRHQGDLKLSLRPSVRDNGTLRFSMLESEWSIRSTEWRAAPGTSGRSPFRSFSLDWNRTFGLGGVNQLELGYNRLFDERVTDFSPRLAQGNVALGIVPTQDQPGLSQLYINGLSGVGSSSPFSATTERLYFVGDRFSILAGRHQLEAGAELLHARVGVTRTACAPMCAGPLGYYRFSGTFTGLGFADFLLGMVAIKERGEPYRWEQRQNRIGVFVEDAFHPYPTLTATAGVRWSYFSPWVEVSDRQLNFDLATGAALPAGKDGRSRGLYDPYYRGFEPRLGLAWTPRSGLVLRAGYGIVQSMEGIPIGRRLTDNPPHVTSFARSYDRTTGGGGTGFGDVPTSVYKGSLNVFDPHLKPQWTRQWNVFVERELGRSLTINVGYVGHRAQRLLIPEDRNQPQRGDGTPDRWAPTQRRRPLSGSRPDVTQVILTSSRGRSRYDGLQAVVRQRPSRGLELTAAYTLGKAMTHNVQHAGSANLARPRASAFAQDARNPAADYGPAFFDARHTFAFSSVYDLPAFLSGTRISSVFMAHTGFPMTVIDSRQRSLQGSAGPERPNRIGDGRVKNANPDRWIDDGAFAMAPSGEFGNSGVGILRGPGYLMWNLGLRRSVRVHGRGRLTLTVQAFNVLNHPNLGLPYRDFANPTTFGKIYETIDLPRRVEVGMKFEF